MSLRKALISWMLAMVVVSAVFIGSLAVFEISRGISREAQQRVNQDLKTAREIYDEQLISLAEEIEAGARTLSLSQDDLDDRVRNIKNSLGLTVLNVCDKDGIPVAGSYPSLEVTIPLGKDPVLRSAIEGKLSYGTVNLDAGRLALEGGIFLQKFVSIPISSKDEKDKEELLKSGLFRWVGYPILDSNGRVVAVVYGGNVLNSNFDLVDNIRKLVFGTRQVKGKSFGMVSIFLDDIQITTNAAGPDSRRAVGTSIPDEVRRKVLETGEIWNGRIWIMNELYRSACQPLQDPDGRTIGMLYVGLLEAPYAELKKGLIRKLITLIVVIAAAIIVAGSIMVHRIMKPVRQLGRAASDMAKGRLDPAMPEPQSYTEIENLAGIFRRMQNTIVEREKNLSRQNLKLDDTNEKLEKANRNYMELLEFVTHELESPLTEIQSTIKVILDYSTGKAHEKMKRQLTEVKLNCEELQDMVKKCRRLSLIERDELKAHKSEINFRVEVVDACVAETEALFYSGKISLEIECPSELKVFADPELMRIALSNYLTNASTYGREGGLAKLDVSEENAMVTVSVWNEGDSFTEEEAKRLFRKFSRITTEETRDRCGSGLGLFLCKKILELHYGKVSAESEPGKSACFTFTFPNPKQSASS